MPQDQEFFVSVAILGGIIFAGLLIIICLTMLGIAVYRKKKETKLTIHGKEKERQNGRASSHGKW